jgi:hypothetical protein
LNVWRCGFRFRGPVLTEGEGISLHTGIKKADLEGMIGYRAALPDELVKALSSDDALAAGIDIAAMALAWRSTVDRDTEPHRFAIRRRPKNQMQIAGVEPIDDTAVLFV